MGHNSDNTLKIRYLFEYIPFYLLTKLLSSLPFRVSVNAGKMLGRLVYRIDRRRRNIAIENISLALGMNKEESDVIVRKVFENLGMVFAEFVNIPRLGKDYFAEKIAVEGFENYVDAERDGKGVLILGAHLGNWEFNPPSHLTRVAAASVVYRKTKNPYVERFVDSIRRSYGLNTIPHRNSVREIMAALRRGEGVGLLLDQHTGEREAVVVDFFGRPAATNIGFAVIALKTGAPVVPMFMVREGEGYRAAYEEPVRLHKTGDTEKDIRDATIRFNNIIENYVRRYPDQWFWVHRRWKV